jgi:hypothetical protein
MAACGCADEYIEQILLSERLVLAACCRISKIRMIGGYTWHFSRSPVTW